MREHEMPSGVGQNMAEHVSRHFRRRLDIEHMRSSEDDVRDGQNV